MKKMFSVILSFALLCNILFSTPILSVFAAGDQYLSASVAGYDPGVDSWVYTDSKIVTIRLNNVSALSGKRLEIELAEGMSFVSYPGMPGKPLSGGLDAVVNKVYNAENESVFGISSYKILSGSVAYDFIDTMNSATIEIIVIPDNYRFYGDKKIADGIKINLYSDYDIEAPSNVPVESSYFDCNLKETSVFVLPVAHSGVPREFYVSTDTTATSTNLSTFSVKQVAFKELEYAFTYSDGLDLKGFSYSGTKNSISPKPYVYDGVTYDWVYHDEENNTIKFYFKNESASPWVQLNLTTNVDGVYYIEKFDINAKYYDNTTQSFSYASAYVQKFNFIDSVNASNRLFPLIEPTTKTRPVGVTPSDLGDDTKMLDGLTYLGRFVFQNRDGSKITNQSIRFDFGKALNVRGFDMPVDLVENTALSYTIKYVVFGDSTVRETTRDFTASNKRIRVSAKDLNLGSDEILQWVSTDVGDFYRTSDKNFTYDQRTNSTDGTMFFGNVLESAASSSDADRTIKATVSSDDSKADLVDAYAVTLATARSNAFPTSASLYSVKADGTRGVLTTNFAGGQKIMAYGGTGTYGGISFGTMQRIQNPVLYLLVPKTLKVDANSIKITGAIDDKTRGNVVESVDITTKTISGVDYDLVEIKTKGIMGQLTNDLGTFGSFIFQFVFEPDRLAPTKSYDLRDILFVAPNPEVSFTVVAASGSTIIKDTNDLNGNGNVAENFGNINTSKPFYVTKNETIQVYGEAKLGSSPESGYLVYDPTNTTTQEATTLILTPGTEVDYRVNIINGMANDIGTFRAFIPVPKKSNNLGSVFSDKSNWDMNLKGAIAGFDDDLFAITYSTNATTTNYDEKAKDYSGIQATYATAAQITATNSWSSVNLIKVELKSGKKIDTGSSKKIDVQYVIASSTVGDGTDNIFHPQFYVDTGGVSYMKQGDNIAIKLKKDYIEGTAWHDTNKDGVKDDGEAVLSGVSVSLYNSANALIDSVNTSATGEFIFPSLDAGKYRLTFSKAGSVPTKVGNDSMCDKNGDIAEVDTSLSESRSVLVGFAENLAPVIQLGKTTDRVWQNKPYQFPAVSITDDFDGTITFNSSVHAPTVVSTSTAGKFTQTFSATDSHGTTGTATQSVYVDGTPVFNEISQLTFTSNVITEAMVYELVKASYQKATDSGLVTTDIALKLTDGNSLPSTYGVFNISFSVVGREDITKSIKIVVVKAPDVTASSSGNNYVSGSKINNDVTLSISQISGLTLKYSKNGGVANTVSNPNSFVVSAEELSTYKFWYDDHENLSTSFVVDICKTKPTLTIDDTQPISGNVYGANTAAVIAATFPSRNNVTTTYSLSGASSNTYVSGTTLLNGSYVFTLTDSYSNVSTYSFSVDTIAPVVEIQFKTDVLRRIGNIFTFGNYFNDYISVVITATDANTANPTLYYQKTGYGVDYNDADWAVYSASFSITPDEKGTIHAKAKDSVDNMSGVVKKSYVVDASAPVISIENQPILDAAENNGWIIKPDTVASIKISDPVAGIAEISYSYSNDSTTLITIPVSTEDLHEKSFNIPLTTDGTYQIIINTKDLSGNTANTVTINVKRDIFIPQLTLSADNTVWVSDETGIVINAAATSGASANALAVARDDESAVAVIGSTFTATQNGIYTFTLTNGAGIAVVKTIEINHIDNVSPVVPAVKDFAEINDKWFSTAHTVVAEVNVTFGVEEFVEHKIGEDGTWVTGGEVELDNEGENIIFFRTGDTLNRYSDEVKVVINIDKTKPEIIAEVIGADDIEVEVLTTLSLEEILKAINIKVSDNFDENAVLNVDGYDIINFNKLSNYVLVLSATDHVGNVSDSVMINVVVSDSTKPQITAEGKITYKSGSKISAEQLLADIKAAVTDNFDSNIAITVAGFDGIDFNKKGNYDVVLNAVDASGNVADPVTITVVISANEKPVVPVTGQHRNQIVFNLVMITLLGVIFLAHKRKKNAENA